MIPRMLINPIIDEKLVNKYLHSYSFQEKNNFLSDICGFKYR